MNSHDERILIGLGLEPTEENALKIVNQIKSEVDNIRELLHKSNPTYNGYIRHKPIWIIKENQDAK